jgi:hypothetical protein
MEARMKPLARIVAIAGAAALLISSFAGPAAATVENKAALVVVNGVPRTKIDICFNGKEVKSGLRYEARPQGPAARYRP